MTYLWQRTCPVSRKAQTKNTKIPNLLPVPRKQPPGFPTSYPLQYNKQKHRKPAFIQRNTQKLKGPPHLSSHCIDTDSQ